MVMIYGDDICWWYMLMIYADDIRWWSMLMIYADDIWLWKQKHIKTVGFIWFEAIQPQKQQFCVGVVKVRSILTGKTAGIWGGTVEAAAMNHHRFLFQHRQNPYSEDTVWGISRFNWVILNKCTLASGAATLHDTCAWTPNIIFHEDRGLSAMGKRQFVGAIPRLRYLGRRQPEILAGRA